MRRPLTGRTVLIWLGGFFAVVMAVNVAFIVVSVKTFRGEDEEKPYLQGVEYNHTLAARAEQARLGWSASLAVRRLADGHVRLDVALDEPHAVAPDGLQLSAELRHPADENRDRRVRLLSSGRGRFWADAGTIGRGQWDVVVTSDSRATPFTAVRRLWVP
jgi:nitrogen fixation protein FixH